MITLNKTLALIATTLAFAVTQGAHAQDAASAPKSRMEVKAETKKAKAAGGMATPTEGDAATVAPKGSTTTRAAVKAETKKAKAEGTLVAPTEGSAPASAPAKAAKSTKTRAEVKAETVKAMKEGKLVPAGEK